MATCADCVHVEVCKMHYRQKCELTYESEREVEIAMCKAQKAVDIECDYYKDRSRFVEMPFQLGDDVYCTRMFKIYKKTVKKIELDDEGIAIITEDGYCIDSSICFRSQKEAEQALMKEREKYGQGTDDRESD